MTLHTQKSEIVASELSAPRDLSFAPKLQVLRSEGWLSKMSKQLCRGFTLIELLVVIAIMAVLVALAFPVFSGIQEKARVTQDMSNLRQIGIATQTYLNDNDGILFSSSSSWVTQLQSKYLGLWKIFQSPFDRRPPSENAASAPVSYGINGNGIVGLAMDKIQKTSAFILFAPAQRSGSSVSFTGTPAATVVTVYKATSNPGGAATGGTHHSRGRINALFADWHSENLLWTTFIADTPATDASANYRWDPAGKSPSP